MKRIYALLALAMAMLIALCSCSAAGETTESAAETAVPVTATVQLEQVTSGNEATITLSNDSVSIDGSGVTLDNHDIIITGGGTYTVSGTLNDGRIIVAAQKQVVNIILDGASITCTYSAAVNIYKSKQTIITLAEGSENSITDASVYDYSDSYSSETDSEPNAALFSHSDLVINGSGALTVNGRCNNGINGKDTLQISACTLTVNAVNHAVKGKDSLLCDSGSYTLTSGGDGFHSAGEISITGGSYTISSQDDGIHSDTTVNLTGGDINITESYEGIEGYDITVAGAVIRLNASDDGFNIATGSADATDFRAGNMQSSTAGTLTVSSGFVYVNAAGDGLDANGSIVITGGTVIVDGPTNSGNAALDYDGSCTVSGGTLIAAGSSGMALGLSSNTTQCGALINLSSTQSAGTLIYITNSDGAVVAAYAPSKSYSSLCISSKSMQIGEEYSVFIGGNAEGDATDGLYAGASGGTLYTTFTQSQASVSVGSSGAYGGGMGGGMMQGGMGGMAR